MLSQRLRAAARPRWAALVLAGWMRFVGGSADGGAAALPLDDPLAEPIRAAVAMARTQRPGALAEPLLGLEQTFGEDLRDSAVLRALVVEWLAVLESQGTAGALAALGDGRSRRRRAARGAGVGGAR